MNKSLSKRIAQANRYIAFAREHDLWGTACVPKNLDARK